jgi:oligo-1,6-glucosidase
VSEPAIDRRWWKEAVVYQIYPRSFNDSDGDGVGDLRGITEKVDYLEELGVDAVWLTPVYASPGADNGYDVSDYREIDPELGTTADWEALRDALHDRDIGLIMDLVVNYTSDEHAWFERSRAGDPAYEDFYWWREGTDAEAVPWNGVDGEGPAGEAPPNGWRSIFGGPAWAYEEGREAWYLHLFDRKQPDLNWRNPQVRGAVYEMMEWWLDRGIDGFRLDAIAHLGKAEGLPTDPEGPLNGTMAYAGNQPAVHEYLTEMRERVLSPDLLTVGEVGTPAVPIEDARAYLDSDRDGLSMLVHFEHMRLDHGERAWELREWTLPELKTVVDRWAALASGGEWVAQYLSNHDQPRQVSRFGSESYRRASAKLLGTLLHTLPGTPFVYQGEELGLENYPWGSPEEFRDVATTNPIERAIEAGEIDSFEAVREGAAARSRDNARTPMQWDDSANAGFTEGEPWIAPHPQGEAIDVASARENPDSVWHYYRKLIALRSDEDLSDVIVYADYEQLTPEHGSLWAYTRTLGEECLLVALNFADEPTAVSLPAEAIDGSATLSLVLANYDPPAATTGVALRDDTLRPWEARIYRVDGE